MTSTTNVPPKFYQVCRLCLTVVSDTSDLVKLAVFGRDKCHQQPQQQQPLIASVEAEEIVVPVTPSSISASVGGGGGANNHHHHHVTSVIVKSNNGKLNRKNSNGSDNDTNNSGSGNATNDINDEHDHAHHTKAHNNNNIVLDHHEHEKNINYFGNATSTNYGINDVADAQTDLLERIHTFLAVSVSRQYFPNFLPSFFFYCSSIFAGRMLCHRASEKWLLTRA